MGRPIVWAVLACLTAGAGFFGVVFLATRDAHLAEGLGALPLIAVHSMAEGIEKRGAAAKTSNNYAKGYNLNKYLIRWYWVVIGGVATILAVGNVLSMFSGLITAIVAPGDRSKLLLIAGATVLIPILFAGFLLGRWAGLRSNTFGVWIVLFYCLLGNLLFRGMDYVLMSPDDFKAVFSNEKNLPLFLEQVLGGAALYGIPGALGYWRGHLGQLDGYVAHLMKLLPKETREVVTSMIFDEVNRLPPEPPAVGAAVAAAAAGVA